jgi:hypothetical protein
MAEIPADLPASAAQSGVQAREVAKERDARRTGQIETASRQTKAIDEAGSTVETTDGDVAIFSDAEGSGSEGRESEEQTADQQKSDDQATSGGFAKGDDGLLHIDLEA